MEGLIFGILRYAVLLGAFGKSLIMHFFRRWERGVGKSVK